MDFAAFEEDGKTVEAVVFNLSQIGELVRFVDEDLQSRYPQIDWIAMRGLRNRIIHDYDNVSVNIIFAIIKNDLPKLANEIKESYNSQFTYLYVKNPPARLDLSGRIA